VQEPDLGGSGGRVLSREEAHGGALERWGLGGGRPEEQLVAVLEGQGGALYSRGGHCGGGGPPQ
jgi:hypothetical protein